MVQHSSTPLEQRLAQLLAQTLGQALSESELTACLKQVEILEPTAGKRFWQAGGSAPGIHIILAGKVRLLDNADNVIVSLETGESFGELTLFPEEQFQFYTARASVKLKLCYIPGDCLRSLMRHSPRIATRLRNQAVHRNTLLEANATQSISQSNTPQVDRLHPIDQPPPKMAVVSQALTQEKGQKRISKAYFPNPTMKVGQWWQRVTRRYPFFEQQSAADCGAACLVMVGRYWGKRFNLNRLRDIANVDRNGASLRGVSAAAESIGFSTRPVRASLDKLAQQQLPAIVHWEGKHYIVVYEVTRDRVIVADPIIGQRTLTHAAFKAGWTGYTLLLQPTALLRDTEEASQPFWQFFELVKPHRLVLLEIFIASLLIQVFGLVTPLFTQLLLDRVVVQRSDLTLTTVGIGLLVFGLFRVAMTGLRQYLLDHTANKVDLALIVGFISHTFRLPLHFFESRYVGDIISRVQENRKIQRFLTGEALSILLDLLTVFVYVGLMFWYSWKMALLTLAIVPPFVLLALIATPFLQRVSREIFSAYNEETGYLIQSLTGIRTVKSMAVEQSVRWHWEELFGRSIKKTFAGQLIGNNLQVLSSAIETIMTTALLWFGAWQVIQGELTIGQLVAFNMLLGNALGVSTEASLGVCFGLLDGQDSCRVNVPAGTAEA